VPKFETLGSLGYAGWFISVERCDFAWSDVAICTVAGAVFAHDQERGNVLGVTFPLVWALGGLADRVQIQVFDQAGSAGEIF